jgi:hypothetical protein
VFDAQVGPIDADVSYDALIAIDHDHHTMPDRLSIAVLPVLERLASLPLV